MLDQTYRETDLLTSDEDEIVEASFTENSNSRRQTKFSTMKDSSAESEDEDIIKTKNRNKNRLALSSSEDEFDEVESRAFSPATRMSITGIRPADLDSDEGSEIAESDEELELQTSNVENSSQIISSKSGELDSDSSSEQKSERSPHIDDSSIHNSQDSSVNKSQINYPNGGSFVKQKQKSLSFDSETSLEKIDDNQSDEMKSYSEDSEQESVTSSHITRSADNSHDSKKMPDINISSSFMKQKQDSPRLTEINFDDSIVSKLSSTVVDDKDPKDSSKNTRYQEVTKVINDSTDSKHADMKSREDIPSTSSSLKLISVSNQAIEISSGSDTSCEMSPLEKPTFSKIQSKLVSKEFYTEKKKELDGLIEELSICERLKKKLGSNLPDKGEKMSGRVEKLKTEIKKRNDHILTLKIEDEPPKQINPPTWEEISAAANEIQPVHTGKIGIATFTAQKTLTIDRLKDIHGSLETCPNEDVLADDPKELKIELMKHQRHAIAWMNWREKQKPRGGILADDMGLGKTLTMISLILSSNAIKNQNGSRSSESSEDENQNSTSNKGWCAKGRRDYHDGGTLVVCPASLIRQWETEIQTRTKSNTLQCCVHHGNNRDSKPRHLARYDVVITTYNIVARESKAQNGTIFSIKWERIILDEGHVIRNHKSQSSIAVCNLKSRRRWVLTGTPIQNKTTDLYALLKFLRCSPFDDLKHWKTWIDNKSAGGQQRLHTLMKSLMLRRTKAQLQENGSLMSLPERDVTLIEVALDKEEMNVYQKVMVFSRSLFAQFLYQRAEKDNDANLDRPNFAKMKDPNNAFFKMHTKFASLHNHGRDVKTHEILVLLLRLRQICCHPGLINAMLEDEDNTSQIDTENEENQSEIDLLEHLQKLQIEEQSTSTSSTTLPNNLNSSKDVALSKASSKVLLKSNPVFDFKRPSSKLKAVLDVFDEKILNTSDKAILISQWSSVLNILKPMLIAKRIKFSCLDGSVPVKDRNDIVTEFNQPNSGPKILLLSLTAGGVGLNLVGANHLFLMDLHWNPQLESQAQDRIYRFGQKKPVHVYKFMCKDTIEQQIKKLQDHKLSLANDVMTGVKSSTGSKLTMEDLKLIFGM